MELILAHVGNALTETIGHLQMAGSCQSTARRILEVFSNITSTMTAARVLSGRGGTCHSMCWSHGPRLPLPPPARLPGAGSKASFAQPAQGGGASGWGARRAPHAEDTGVPYVRHPAGQRRRAGNHHPGPAGPQAAQHHHGLRHRPRPDRQRRLLPGHGPHRAAEFGKWATRRWRSINFPAIAPQFFFLFTALRDHSKQSRYTLWNQNQLR